MRRRRRNLCSLERKRSGGGKRKEVKQDKKGHNCRSVCRGEGGGVGKGKKDTGYLYKVFMARKSGGLSARVAHTHKRGEKWPQSMTLRHKEMGKYACRLWGR